MKKPIQNSRTLLEKFAKMGKKKLKIDKNCKKMMKNG